MVERCHWTIILIIIFSGCGSLNYHLETVDRSLEKILQVRQQYEQEYVGKPKEVLNRDFGDPQIKHNVYHFGVLYEEEWFYRTSGSWMQTDPGGAVWFYIKSGKVAAVSVS